MGVAATIQAPGIILPLVAPTGTETEIIANLLEHTSLEFPVEELEQKTIQIIATEVIVAGIPGNLWCWVELSPFPSVNNNVWPAPLPATALYWGAIGGGGGALPPVAPLIEVAVGVNGTVHPIVIPWLIHSGWARLVIQTPVAPALPTAFWVVQAVVTGKNPG